MKLQLAKVIGHRGASGYAPENTLTAMTKAYQLGVKWVEFDVMLAGCGEPIIIHDESLERTTTGTGLVVNTRYDKISQLDCGSWFAAEYQGEKVPTFRNLLLHLSAHNLSMNVEIKPVPGYELETTQKTLESIKHHWPDMQNPPLISSFSIKVIELASTSPYPLGYVIDSWDSPWEETLEKYNCVSLHVDQSILTAAWAKRVKDTGRYLLAYTVNSNERAQELYSWGVDSVFSDFPDLITPGD